MGDAGGAPHPLVYQFYMKKIQKYIQKHTKNMQIHINICKNVETHMGDGKKWGPQKPGIWPFVKKSIQIHKLLGNH